MAEATELGVRIVEALGPDVTFGEAMLALGLVRKWLVGDTDELPASRDLDQPVEGIARVLRDALADGASADDTELAIELVSVYLADTVTEPRAGPPPVRPSGA